MILIFRREGLFYRTGMWLYHFMYLNILFILSCLPVITIFPALAALFGVVREWQNNKEVEVFSQFKRLFIENWKQSYLVGILFSFIGLFLLADFLFLQQMMSVFKYVIYGAVILTSFLFLISLITIYPIMVNMMMSFKQLCISSVKVGLYKLHLTVLCIVLLSIWYMVSLRFSFLLFLFFFSFSAYLIYWITDLKFSKIIAQEDTADPINHPS